MNTIPPPPYQPIRPHQISERWFPADRPFGLYANAAGKVAPNVTSILSWKFPFDRRAWVEREPGIDHDAVTLESSERGTAVHQAMEAWLSHQDPSYPQQYAAWVEPLRQLVARAQVTIGVEVPIHHAVFGVGRYAGSCDGLVVGSDGAVVIIDYKTKRPGKRVHPRYLDKQRLQLAAYSIAINAIYGDQLPGPVTRCSLLFAHPDRDRPTVVMTEGDELRSYQKEWVNLLSIWYQEHGEAVEAEQAAFDLHAAS
jgi:hypothetical protein